MYPQAFTTILQRRIKGILEIRCPPPRNMLRRPQTTETRSQNSQKGLETVKSECGDINKLQIGNMGLEGRSEWLEFFAFLSHHDNKLFVGGVKQDGDELIPESRMEMNLNWAEWSITG